MRHHGTDAYFEVALHHLGVDIELGTATGGIHVDAIIVRCVIIYREAFQDVGAQLLLEVEPVHRGVTAAGADKAYLAVLDAGLF